uniref:methyltransferase, FxLD system n=1 Tax=Nonomuraea sp. CA-252377 TaxID=3240003 RepID=UPI003F491497
MSTDIAPAQTPEQLRTAMVSTLLEQGWITSGAVREAFAAVPRERFAPEASPEAAYAVNDVVVTKRDAAGRAMSSVSAPWLQAAMLESAALRPGAKVLEVGSGGCNAALIAELVGPEGLVVSVDIDPFVTERAARFLAETGYGHVRVVLGDAEHVAHDHAPEGGFDAIVVTAGVWDVPWADLLAPAGRLVVPLRFRTVTRSFTFVVDGDHLTALDATVCGFVAVQGAGAFQDQEAELSGGAVRLTRESGPALDVAALDRALTGSRTELWTGVTVGRGESFDSMHLYLAATDDRFGMIWANRERGGYDLVDLVLRWSCPVLITSDSFAYLTLRDADGHVESGGERRLEFGAHGHGPAGPTLAEELRRHVLAWDAGWRSRAEPAFLLYPADAVVSPPQKGKILGKRHTQLILAWD